MFFQFTSLVNQPVHCLATQSSIAKVKNIVVDPENGQIIAFLVSQGIFTQPKVLSCNDIKEIGSNFLIIDSPEVIVAKEEIIKVNEILQNRIKVINNWVKTERGKLLGKVYDVLFEAPTFYINKYYVRPACRFCLFNILALFQEERIISREKIISIGAKAIIVSDEEKEAAKEEEEVKAAVPEPA